MTEKKAIVPVLSSSSKNLSDPTDIIEYLLRYYFHTPKNISDTLNAGEISFRYDEASYSGDPIELRKVVERALGTVLNRYFGNADNLTVSVTIEKVDEGNYNIVIDISVVISGIRYSIDKNIKVDKDGNVIFDVLGGN